MTKAFDPITVEDFGAKWAFLIVLISAAGFISLAFMSMWGIGQLFLICATVLGSTIRLFWPARREKWFIFCFLLIGMLHLVLFVIPVWPADGYRAQRLAPIIALDMLITIGFVLIVSRISRRQL
jgi:hypothetical protein